MTVLLTVFTCSITANCQGCINGVPLHVLVSISFNLTTVQIHNPESAWLMSDLHYTMAAWVNNNWQGAVTGNCTCTYFNGPIHVLTCRK